MNTLSERIKKVSEGIPRGWQGKLAKLCGISAPSVADWVSGKTRSISGEYLLVAASFFDVNPTWLATGRGQMRSGEAREAPAPELNPREQAMLGLFQGLTQRQQDEMLRMFEEKKQRNDELLNELLNRKAG